VQFGLPIDPTFEPLYNIAPSSQVLIVRASKDGRRLADRYRWGLIPGWAKDPSIGNKLANARGETIADKPAFRTGFAHWRCLVPASGFYEWKTAGGKKCPFYIRPKGNELFGLAGITEYWKGPEGEIRTVCLITTAPNELMAPIHDRMPVVIPRDSYRAWLDPLNEDTVQLKGLIASYPAERMEAYPVSKSVSNARNEGAALIESIEGSREANKRGITAPA
jgi:putative SOS response-associated peptidase YedK